MIDKNVGKRIREYREKSGISQEYLGEQAGLSKTSVSNIERGNNYPALENFIKIANIIGVSADLLLCDVVEEAKTVKASELSDKLQHVSSKKRQQIYAIIDTMLSSEE